jgi:hypothetical protein
VGRGDAERTCAELFFDGFICNDLYMYFYPAEIAIVLLADKLLIARIIWMDCDGDIADFCLGSCC